MKTNRVQDERVLMQQRKIIGEAYSLVLLALYLSVFIKQVVFSAAFSAYAVELLVAIGSTLYILARNIHCGFHQFYNKKPQLLIRGAFMASAIAALVTFGNLRDGRTDKLEIAVEVGAMLLSCVAAFLGVFFVIHTLERRKAQQIQRQLDEEENRLDD